MANSLVDREEFLVNLQKTSLRVFEVLFKIWDGGIVEPEDQTYRDSTLGSKGYTLYLTPEFLSYTQELINSGYSYVQSQALAEALFSSRQVIAAKHAAYIDRLNEDRLGKM